MSREARSALGWTLLGMVLMGAIIWFTMPRLMLVDRLSSHDYGQTVALLEARLGSQGDWRVLAVNDYQKATAAFATIPRTGSLNVCNPRYASQILATDADRGVTALMPLAIGVYEDAQGHVHVSRLNVGLVGRMFGGTIAQVMATAGEDLGATVAAVTED